jgi:hypothetical protein
MSLFCRFPARGALSRPAHDESRVFRRRRQRRLAARGGPMYAGGKQVGVASTSDRQPYTAYINITQYRNWISATEDVRPRPRGRHFP